MRITFSLTQRWFFDHTKINLFSSAHYFSLYWLILPFRWIWINAAVSFSSLLIWETTRLCPYILEPTRLWPHDCAHTRSCPHTFVPTHVCAQKRLCPDTFVPTHIWAQTRLCPHTVVPTHVCAHTRLCPHTFVPRHVCAHTCLCPYTFVPWHVIIVWSHAIMSGQKRVRLWPDTSVPRHLFCALTCYNKITKYSSRNTAGDCWTVVK